MKKKIIGKRLDAITLARMMEHVENIQIDYLITLEELEKKEKEKKKKKKKPKKIRIKNNLV